MQPIYTAKLEIRQEGGKSVISGVFPYNELATVSSRGRTRKERISSRAFEFAINDQSRSIDLLVGHDPNRPLARRQAGTLEIEDGDDAVRFQATLPDNPPSWVVDAERSIDAGLMDGLSPGFVVPPRSVVANAEELLPEPGNPGIQIRQVNAAVLREFSLVTRPVYTGGSVELREEDWGAPAFDWRRLAWL